MSMTLTQNVSMIPDELKIIPTRCHLILFSSYYATIVFVLQQLIGYHGNLGHFEISQMHDSLPSHKSAFI